MWLLGHVKTYISPKDFLSSKDIALFDLKDSFEFWHFKSGWKPMISFQSMRFSSRWHFHFKRRGLFEQTLHFDLLTALFEICLHIVVKSYRPTMAYFSLRGLTVNLHHGTSPVFDSYDFNYLLQRVLFFQLWCVTWHWYLCHFLNFLNFFHNNWVQLWDIVLRNCVTSATEKCSPSISKHLQEETNQWF